MEMGIDDYPDLDFGVDDANDDYDKSMAKKRFYVPVASEELGIGRSLNFVSDPTVVHFGGFTIHEEVCQDISVINVSSHSQRISIMPPTTDAFKITYSKCGILAPGMAQKICVKFSPGEYKYHYDCIRIHADGQDLLVPLHGYPVINKVNFPSLISFGNSPLSEPVQKVITLGCSIPVNFSFNIEVIQPHPYFKISPLRGVVPANGEIEIVVTFNPITLGTCTTVVQLYIAQHNFKPIEAVINARAVSGIIETHALCEVEKNLASTLIMKEEKMLSRLGNSTFNTRQLQPQTETGDMENTISSTTGTRRKRPSKEKTSRTKIDPVAAVLKKTFGADDVESTLKSAMVDSKLMSCKVPAMIESGPLHGTKKVIGESKATQHVNKRGVGSGNVFDAGAEYIAEHNRRRMIQTGFISRDGDELSQSDDRVVDGLRVPKHLNSTTAVNFVLTQESGKLKPKDLKIAIEKNREERRKQEAEQQKIREEGGGGDGGGCLDLRAIINEEKLNAEPGDAFKRQLREMAFLADVDDVKKLEAQKAFRVSEEFLGGTMLTEADIAIVQAQRKASSKHRKRTEWRGYQSRMHTKHFIPESDEVRAGAPTTFLLAEGESPAQPASFDPNKNDMWSKRMNTLKRFISIVGKWIVQRRIEKRLAAFRKTLAEHNVTDRESMRQFVEEDSNKIHRLEYSKPSTPPTTTTFPQSFGLLDENGEVNASMALLVCSMSNQAVEKKKRSDAAMNEIFNVTPSMARRVLFPKYVADEASTRKKMEMVSIDDPMNFDDRSFFQLKVRAEYVDMGYHKEIVPPSPVYFLPTSTINQPCHRGAPEENSIRPAAGALYTAEDIKVILSSGSDDIFAKSVFPLPPAQPLLKPEEHHGRVTFGENSVPPPSVALEMETGLIASPAWMTETRHREPRATYSQSSADRDVFRVRPEFRTYGPQVMSKETDADWVLRPTNTRFEFDSDASLRSRLLQIPGFMSAHTYLLGSYASRIGDPYPQPGPTLTNFYMPDMDRHGSGLCCMRDDYIRPLLGEDHGVAPLQYRLAKEDHLTDSESDDDDVYEAPKPTMKTVKAILKYVPPPPVEVIDDTTTSKGKKGKDAKKAPEPVPPVPAKIDVDNEDAFSVLEEENRRMDQVELIRDRKILDFQTHMRKERESKMNLFTDRLVKISQAATCSLQALSVQLPIHQYEEEVLDVLEKQVPILSNSFVEQGLNQSLGSPSRTLGGL